VGRWPKMFGALAHGIAFKLDDAQIGAQ